MARILSIPRRSFALALGFSSSCIEISSWWTQTWRSPALPAARCTTASPSSVRGPERSLDFRRAEKLTIRVEGRYDGSNNNIFLKGTAPQFTKHQATVAIGLAVRSF